MDRKALQTCIVLIALFSSYFSFSQNTISGKVFTEEGEPLSGTNITITDSATKFLGFTTTNNQGLFSIKVVDTETTPLFINAKRLQYAPIRYEIENKTQVIDLVMIKENTILEEVVIETQRPVSQRGDTIAYQISAFAEQKDRNIGEVLSKLPGIEVLPDGRVLYQGRPIEKYYIEGMDLLEGKYNLVNSNLPHKSVSSVEILENHQPIRVLDSLNTSDKTSLNIRLKEEVTVTGVSKLAMGGKPLLWETNITPMFFTKNKQTILSYQANNSGFDSGRELRALTLDDLIQQQENTLEKVSVLQTVAPNLPTISNKRFLDNNVHMLTANFLSKRKDKTEVRLNLSYINDYQKQLGSQLTKYFLPQEDLMINETIENSLFTNDFRSNLTLHKNTKNSYFKNSFKTQLNWDGARGLVQMDDAQIEQHLKNPYYSFSNQLKWITPIGNQLVTIYSLINYNRSPHELSVYPGQFKDVLNEADNYTFIRQELQKNIFQANNYLGFDKKLRNYTFGNKFGFNIVNNNTNSQLFQEQNRSGNMFSNHQNTTTYSLYIDPTVEYKYKKWEVKAQIPLAYQGIQLTDNSLHKKQKAKGLVFNPRVNLQYNWTGYWKTTTSLGYTDAFQDTESLIYGYIMKNYRTLQKTDYPIERKKGISFHTGMSYRNPIKSLFFNAFYFYSQSTNPFMLQNIIQEDGGQWMTILNKETTQYNHTINTKLSKYFNRFKTTVSLGLDLQTQKGNQVVNTTTVTAQNKIIKPNLNLNTRFSDNISIDYKLGTNFHFNKTGVLAEQHFFTLSENMQVNIYPSNNQSLGFLLEHYYTDLATDYNHNFYADFLYRYTITKSKIDLELRVMNLFNENNYINTQYTDYYFSQSIFKIRPRQIMVGATFSF